MREAIALFEKIYYDTHDIEISIAELKRANFTQLETTRALIEVLHCTLMEADKRVMNSLAWSN